MFENEARASVLVDAPTVITLGADEGCVHMEWNTGMFADVLARVCVLVGTPHGGNVGCVLSGLRAYITITSNLRHKNKWYACVHDVVGTMLAITPSMCEKQVFVVGVVTPTMTPPT